MQRTRRAVLAVTSAATTTALAGCSGLFGNGSPTQQGEPTDTVAPDAVATVSIPDDTGGLTYATMGTSGPVVTYFGSWKCPHCASFGTGSGDMVSLPRIVADYIEAGDLRLRFRCIGYDTEGKGFLGPDAPRAARAGLAVWNRDPGSYWRYHETVMANQGAADEKWATTDKLVQFAKDAGVSDVEGVRADIENGKYEQPVKVNTQAFADAGAEGTPSLIIDGENYNPGDRRETRNALDEYAGN